MIYVVEFFIFSFLGWIIDSTYSSFANRKIIISGYLQGLPLCLVYGYGGLLLLSCFDLMLSFPSWLVILVTTVFVIILELIYGWAAEYFLDERLWDYSKEPLNLGGYICAWHSFLWLLLTIVAYLLVGHQPNLLADWLATKITINPHFEVPMVLLILGVLLWLTVKTKKLRLSKKNQKRLAELTSIEEIFDFSKLLSLEKQKRLILLSNQNINKFIKKIKKFSLDK